MDDSNVTITPLTEQYYDLVAQWMSDPEINRWLSSNWRGKIFSATQIAIVNSSPRTRLFIALCDHEPAGIVGLTQIDMVDRISSMIVFVGPREFLGRRIIKRAEHQLFRYAFHELGLHVVMSSSMASNAAVRKLARRVGWREAGIQRRGFYQDGQFVDRIFFDFLPEDLVCAESDGE